MQTKTNNRDSVIDNDTYLLLNEYLKFRHVFRHGYTFQLKWDKMKRLAVNLSTVWKSTKEQVLIFTQTLSV